jgi:hypothetical protein
VQTSNANAGGFDVELPSVAGEMATTDTVFASESAPVDADFPVNKIIMVWVVPSTGQFSLCARYQGVVKTVVLS